MANSNYYIVYNGIKDFVKSAIPAHQRTDKFLEFLEIYFDRIYNEIYNAQKDIYTLHDPMEVNLDYIGYLSDRFVLDFDYTDLTVQEKREFIRDLVWLMKRKGTYNSIEILWKLLPELKTRFSLYERWHDKYLTGVIPEEEYIDIEYLDVYDEESLTKKWICYNDTAITQDSAWVYDGSEYSKNVLHNFNQEYVLVNVWNVNTSELEVFTITAIDHKNISLTTSTETDVEVKLYKHDFDAEITKTSWTYDSVSELYYKDVEHNLDQEYPFVTTWNIETDEIEKTVDIQYINSNTIRFWITERENLSVLFFKKYIDTVNFTTNISDWTLDGDIYYVEITHGLDKNYPFISTWNLSTNKYIKSANIISTGYNTVRIEVNDPIQLKTVFYDFEEQSFNQGWAFDDYEYHKTINHNLDKRCPFVTTWQTDTKSITNLGNVFSINSSSLKLYAETPLDLFTKIFTDTSFFNVSDTEWLSVGDYYYKDIEHGLNQEYPLITTWDFDNKRILRTYDLTTIDNDTTRIAVKNPLNLRSVFIKDLSDAHIENIIGLDWKYDGDLYYKDLFHHQNEEFPFIYTWDITNDEVLYIAEIISTSEDITKLKVETPIVLKALYSNDVSSFEILDTDWTYDAVNAVYYDNLFHAMFQDYPFVIVWNTDTKEVIKTANVISLNSVNSRIEVEEEINVTVSFITDVTGAVETDIALLDWTSEADYYYYEITHNLNIDHPFVTVWNTTTKELIKTADIISLDENTTRIEVEDAFECKIIISDLISDSYVIDNSLTDWVSGGDYYYKDIDHDFGQEYPFVGTWNTDTKEYLRSANVISIDENTTRITVIDPDYVTAVIHAPCAGYDSNIVLSTAYKIEFELDSEPISTSEICTEEFSDLLYNYFETFRPVNRVGFYRWTITPEVDNTGDWLSLYNLSVYNNHMLSRYEIGLTDNSFVFTQDTSSLVWNINHDLGTKHLHIKVFKSDNYEIVPDVIEFVDNNNIQITFLEARIGYVFIKKPEIKEQKTNPIGTWTVNHDLGVKEVITDFSLADEKYYPELVELKDINSLDTTNIFTGYAMTSKGDKVVNVDTPALTWNINHGLRKRGVIVHFYNHEDKRIYPDSHNIIDSNNVSAVFDELRYGYAVIKIVGDYLDDGAITSGNVYYKIGGTYEAMLLSDVLYEAVINDIELINNYYYLTFVIPRSDEDWDIREIGIFDNTYDSLIAYSKCVSFFKHKDFQIEVTYKIEKE